MKPLEGIRVLDFTQYLAGPYCTMLMSDMGAEVVKLEHPPVGDHSRYSPPTRDKKSIYFTSPNRGKKSVFMDLADERQRAVFYRLVEDADAVVSNFRPGTLEKYGCGYEDLKKINPRIVYTTISGFGNNSPWSGKKAYDLTIQALSGIMSMSGEMGGSPIKMGISIADLLGGIYGCIGTVSALYETMLTGTGRSVDISLMDCCIAAMEQGIAQYGITGEIPKPMGNQQITTVPFGDYTTSDGQSVLICPASDDQFRKLCDVVGHPELCETELKFAAERMSQRERVNGLFDEFIGAMTTGEFCGGLEEQKLAYGLINNVEDIVNHEQIRAREMLAEAVYPDGSRMTVPASPFNFTGVKKQTEYPVSPLGYDTFEVLGRYFGEGELHAIYDETSAASETAVAEKEAELR